MAYLARLESVYTRKGIEGSNPSLSALKVIRAGCLTASWRISITDLPLPTASATAPAQVPQNRQSCFLTDKTP